MPFEAKPWQLQSSSRLLLKNFILKGNNSISIKRKNSLQNSPLKQSSKSPSHFLSWFKNMNRDLSHNLCDWAELSFFLIFGAVEMEDASQVRLRGPEPSGSSSCTGLGWKVLLLQHFDIGPVHKVNRQRVFSLVAILNTWHFRCKENGS